MATGTNFLANDHPPQPGPTPFLTWRWFGLHIALPFALTRLLLIAASFVALNQLVVRREIHIWQIAPSGQTEALRLYPTDPSLSFRPYWFVNSFSRWDAEWYLDIAKHGYHYEEGRGLRANTAFFPLYPALIAVLARPFGDRDVTYLLAGLAISHLSLLIGLAFLAALIRLEFDSETAARSILYLLVFPTTLFFSAVYTESLFLALSVIAFYCARRERWWLAGLAAAAATLTRPPGILVCAALGLEYLHQRQFRLRAIRTDILALALSPLALLLHFSYFAWKFGNFWLFFKTEHDWGRPLASATGRLAAFLHFSGGDLFVTLLALVLIPLAWRRLRPSYSLYATLAFLMPLASGTLLGVARYSVIIFPFYILLARAGRHPGFDRPWLILSSSTAILYMVMFCLWRFVG